MRRLAPDVAARVPATTAIPTASPDERAGAYGCVLGMSWIGSHVERTNQERPSESFDDRVGDDARSVGQSWRSWRRG